MRQSPFEGGRGMLKQLTVESGKRPKPLKGLKESTKSKDQHTNGRSKSPL